MLRLYDTYVRLYNESWIFKVLHPWYDYVWYNVNIYIIYYDYSGVIMIECITIINETPWTWCERFTHTLMILRLKRNFHLMSVWATMIPWWYECYAFFNKHEHKWRHNMINKDNKA